MNIPLRTGEFSFTRKHVFQGVPVFYTGFFVYAERPSRETLRHVGSRRSFRGVERAAVANEVGYDRRQGGEVRQLECLERTQTPKNVFQTNDKYRINTHDIFREAKDELAVR